MLLIFVLQDWFDTCSILFLKKNYQFCLEKNIILQQQFISCLINQNRLDFMINLNQMTMLKCTEVCVLV